MTEAGNQTLILKTKLFRAPLPADHVLRPRLVERLQQVKQHPLTLVSAPAGYGKSVLLSSWSEQCNCPTAWLSLDEEDNDLGLFKSYFLAALNSAIPSFGDDLMVLLTGDRVSSQTFVGKLFEELSQLEDDVVFMIDDYGVIANEDVHRLIAELIYHPHPSLHLVLGTRHDPPLPLHEWRAQDRLLELRSVDLRFALEETRTFLRRAIEGPLDDETIVAMNTKTEGWAAGLRLAILSFTRIEDFTGQIDKISGSSVHIRDYLASQVLSSLPAETQLFLLQTSILHRLSASLCQAVIMLEGPIIDVQSTLLELEAANVFMMPLDDSQQWFRYHHLFNDFLLMRLQEGYSTEVIVALHSRASDWFAGNGFIEEALHHAMAAGDMETAVEIVAANRHSLIETESHQRLAHWLKMIPPKIIDSSPDLLLIQALFAQILRFDITELNQLVGKIDALMGHQQFEAQRAQLLAAETESRRGVASFYFDPDLQTALACFRNALEGLPGQYYVLRTYCWVYGAATLQMMGDLSGAYKWIERARREDLTAADGPRVRNAIAEAIVHRLSANLTNLINVSEFLLRNTPEGDLRETRGWGNHFLASALYERNDLEGAQHHAQKVFNKREHTPAANSDNDVILVKIHQARGNADEAREMLKVSLDYAIERRSPPFTQHAESFQIELAVMQGRAHEVTHWAEQAFASLHLAPMHSFYTPALTIPKVLLAVGTPGGRAMAAECLQRIRAYAESTHNVRVLIEVLALEALLHAANKDEKAALEALEQSLALARPGGFIRLYVDLGPNMGNLLRGMKNQEPFVEYIAHILQVFGDDPDHPARPKEEQKLIEPLTGRETEILAFLSKRYSNKEIAAELVISPATVKGHSINLYQKLSVHNRREAVNVARAFGLIPT